MKTAVKNTIKTITTHYIDGAFVESHGREVMDIIRPTDRQVIARVTLADETDTQNAIAAAKRAFATYGRSSTDERAKILRTLHTAESLGSPNSSCNRASTRFSPLKRRFRK
jgi:aldehyde dehydrogenase (NAD+)